jgi:carboxyl-terminal processing protease
MRTRGIPAAAVVVVVCAAVGGLFGGRVMATGDRAAERRSIYTAALAAIETGYVEAPDSAQLVYGSIDGMLRTLDPHSTFFDPKAYAQMRERQSGSYYGLGIQILPVDGDITVTSVFEGSPAYRTGIRRGDVIATIEDHSAKGYTSDQAVAELKGPKGTKVHIGIRRQGVNDLISLTVERDEVDIVTVRTSFMIAPGTGYIRLQDFSDTTDHELSEALRKLHGDGMERLVLDLRDNPGGPLVQAIAVASHFLHKNQMVVYTRGRIPNSDDDYRVTAEGDYTKIPIIVLVNRGSASASEIVTGSMQDHDRGLIVGETTFGKALVQSVYQVSNGAAVALTTAHYYTPSGRIIQRPWDATFDEYLTYQMRDQDGGARPHPASELKFTDAKRKVYGGGGIEPDHFLPGSVEGFSPSLATRGLVGRGAFTSFSRHFTAEGDTRPGSAKSAANHTVMRGWTVTDTMIEEFKQATTALGIRIDDAAFKTDLPFIRAEIKYEVDNELFGAEEARRNLTKVDPQAQAALGYFGEAAKLLDSSKASTSSSRH